MPKGRPRKDAAAAAEGQPYPAKGKGKGKGRGRPRRGNRVAADIDAAAAQELQQRELSAAAVAEVFRQRGMALLGIGKGKDIGKGKGEDIGKGEREAAKEDDASTMGPISSAGQSVAASAAHMGNDVGTESQV